MQVKLDIGSHVYPGCYEDCTGLLLSFFSTFASANSIFMESICLLGRPTMMDTFQILDLFIFETPQCSFLGDRCVARVTRARLSRNIYSVLHVYTYICVCIYIYQFSKYMSFISPDLSRISIYIRPNPYSGISI